MKNRQLGLMAIAAGVSVANVYYSQPILSAIADDIGISELESGRIAMCSQLGYGLAMFFVLPLGDSVDRKRLITTLLLLLTVFLSLLQVVDQLWWIYVCMFMVGVCAVPAQILLPMAASLYPESRGKSVGIVFGGVLTGMLGSRVLAGWITAMAGWRMVYLSSAVLVLLTVVLLWIYLQSVPRRFSGSHLSLIRSTLALIVRHRALREACILGFFTFGLFCSFWTVFTFHMTDLHYSVEIIGLFGALAIGGTFVAPYFGKLADRGNTKQSLYITVSLLMLGVLLLHFFPSNLWMLGFAILLLDIGVQATQITNFARIYALDDQSHSRLNTVYMTCYFMGAATGTYVGLASWSMGEWDGATLQLFVWSLIALGIVRFTKR